MSNILVVHSIDKINNNLFNPNPVRWCSDWLDGAVDAGCLGTYGQTKVSGDHQRETIHEICCLAAE